MTATKTPPQETSIDSIFAPFARLQHKAYIGPVFVYLCAYYQFFIGVLFAIVMFPVSYVYSLYQAYKAITTPKLKWNDQIVLITGTASGIGHKLVERLSKEKNPKLIIAIDVQPHVFNNLSNVVTYACDVGDKTAVSNMSKRIIQAHGNPTIIVNNAGVVSGKSILELSDTDIERTIRVNLMAHIWIVRAFLPNMLKQNSGHIISVASLLGLVTASRLTDYCASKFGAVGFWEALTSELYHTNIRTSILCPGFIKTGMFKGFTYKNKFLYKELEPEEIVEDMIRIMDNNRSACHLKPFYASLAPWIKTLPLEIQVFLRNVTGADESMNNFTLKKN